MAMTRQVGFCAALVVALGACAPSSAGGAHQTVVAPDSGTLSFPDDATMGNDAGPGDLDAGNEDSGELDSGSGDFDGGDEDSGDFDAGSGDVDAGCSDCPASAIYTMCTMDSDCCTDFGTNGCPGGQACVGNRCVFECQVCGMTGCQPATPNACPAAPANVAGVTASCTLDVESSCGGESCSDTATYSYCALACSSGSTCPPGQSCTMGFCSP